MDITPIAILIEKYGRSTTLGEAMKKELECEEDIEFERKKYNSKNNTEGEYYDHENQSERTKRLNRESLEW